MEKEQPQTVFEKVLHRMNEAGGFEASVLASGDGLPIASVPSDYDFQTVAAMVAVLASVAGEILTGALNYPYFRCIARKQMQNQY